MAVAGPGLYSGTMTEPPLPPDLAEIAAEFLSLPPATRLELLVEFGAEVREVPDPYGSDPSLMERVVECQSPVYIVVEVTPTPAGHSRAAVHILAPREAPTTRGFAGVLSEGIGDLSAEQIVNLPIDLPAHLGLEDLVSPLRIVGMRALLGRIQHQIRTQLSQNAASQVS